MRYTVATMAKLKPSGKTDSREALLRAQGRVMAKAFMVVIPKILSWHMYEMDREFMSKPNRLSGDLFSLFLGERRG